jgi:hypothetical protein
MHINIFLLFFHHSTLQAIIIIFTSSVLYFNFLPICAHLHFVITFFFKPSKTHICSEQNTRRYAFFLLDVKEEREKE